MRYIFTFSRVNQWNYEICQVIADSQEQAYRLMYPTFSHPETMNLDSCLPAANGLSCGVVFFHIWENESYEG